MQIDSVPGLTIQEHEGRLAGTFELPPADLAAIEFDGRVMLVIVADVGAPFRVTTDAKDGSHRAHWTFKAVDAALVRDQSMRDHLEKALYIDAAGIVDHPLDVGRKIVPTVLKPASESDLETWLDAASAQIEQIESEEKDDNNVFDVMDRVVQGIKPLDPVDEEEEARLDAEFAKRHAEERGSVVPVGQRVSEAPQRGRDPVLDNFLYRDGDR